MCLWGVGAPRGRRRSSCCFTSQLHRQQLTCLQSCTPWSLVPAALSSANLISVKKQFNPRWAQSLRINTCNLSHYLSFLSAFSFFLFFLRVRTCCSSDPVSGTKILLGMDPTHSLVLCFPGASTGVFPLLEPAPRSHLNVAWACGSWITCGYIFKASSRLLYPCPASCGTSTTCEELAACQASEREPGHGWRVREAADGCAFVSDVSSGRPYSATLSLFWVFAARASAPSETDKKCYAARLSLRLPEVAEGYICLLNRAPSFYLKR